MKPTELLPATFKWGGLEVSEFLASHIPNAADLEWWDGFFRHNSEVDPIYWINTQGGAAWVIVQSNKLAVLAAVVNDQFGADTAYEVVCCLDRFGFRCSVAKYLDRVSEAVFIRTYMNQDPEKEPLVLQDYTGRGRDEVSLRMLRCLYGPDFEMPK